MSDITKPSHYRIYLLTIWKDQGCKDEELPKWRFCLQDPRTGEKYVFSNLNEFVVALHSELIENKDLCNRDT